MALVSFLQIVHQVELFHLCCHIDLSPFRKVQQRRAEFVPRIYLCTRGIKQRLRHTRVTKERRDLE